MLFCRRFHLKRAMYTHDLLKALLPTALLPKTLLRLAFSAVLGLVAFTLPAAAQQATQAQQSFREYQPNPAQFPEALRPVVESVAAYSDGSSPSEAKALQDQISQLRETLSRGYHDELWFLLGLVQERSGQLEAALSSFDRSLQLSNNAPEVLFRKAVVLRKLTRHEKAVEALKEFLWLSKHNTHEARYELGRALCKLQRCPAGLKEIEQALAMAPGFVPALEFLLQEKKKSLARLKDPLERAELEAQITADLRRLVELDPENRDASLALARHALGYSDPLVHGDKLAEAERIARKFSEHSEYKDAEAVRLLFDLYARRGKTQEAANVLERGLKANPTAKTLLNAKRQLEIQRQVDALATRTQAQ